MYYDYGMIDEGLRDITQALAITPSETDIFLESNESNHVVMKTLIGRAYRTAADCYLALGNKNDTENALLKWAQYDTSRRTKAMNEIRRLRQSM
jgi:hypothetical protein